MSQYKQFRRWSQSSSGAEKAVTAVVVSVVLSLTALSLAPTNGSEAESPIAAAEGLAPEGAQSSASALQQGAAAPVGSSATGEQADGAGSGERVGAGSGTAGASSDVSSDGAAVSGSRGGAGAAPPAAVGAAAPGTAPRAASGGAPAAGGGAAGCAVTGDVGVTRTNVKVAAVTLNLAGAIGNGAVGIASPEQQERMGRALVAELNARGGFKCRKVVVDFFEANPLDANSARRACLQIVEQGYWAAVDMGGFVYPQGAAGCVSQRRVPIVIGGGTVPSESRQHAPYLLNYGISITKAARTSILGMKQRGFFEAAKGFKKLGLYLDDCSKEVNDAVFRALSDAGIPRSRISTYTFTCPSSGFASPSDASSAVVKHRQDGVTHVIPVTGGGSFKPYSSFAEQQRFRPTYTILDYNGMASTATGGTGPDRDNFDGTVMVTTSKIGMKPADYDAPTKACAAIYQRRGVPPEWISNGFQAGYYCNGWLTLASAVQKAPGLRRVDIATGLAALGTVQMATPDQDADFGPGDLNGGDYYWVIRYGKACNCWTVLNRSRNKAFD